MIPTYTNQIKTNLITDYFGSNLAVCLINTPFLGITDTPTNQELEARRQFTTANLLLYEIGASELNGYKRVLIPNSYVLENTKIENETATFEVTVEFLALGGDFTEFTHIAVVRGASFTNANDTNGNNRGNTSGSVIFIEPINNTVNPNQPLILTDGMMFTYTFTLSTTSTLSLL